VGKRSATHGKDILNIINPEGVEQLICQNAKVLSKTAKSHRSQHGFGFGCRFNFPFGWFEPFDWWRPFPRKSEYLEMLKNYRDALKEKLEEIEKEIKELEEEKRAADKK